MTTEVVKVVVFVPETHAAQVRKARPYEEPVIEVYPMVDISKI